MDIQKRKRIRMKGYDYSSNGAYFVTICISERRRLLWENGDNNCRNGHIPLSYIGRIVDNEIQKLNAIYPNVTVDEYCIMPDHIHMIILFTRDESGRTQFAPTLSRVIKQFKGSITKQIGTSIWQKSFMDRIIRDEHNYIEILRYIAENPLKMEKSNE